MADITKQNERLDSLIKAVENIQNDLTTAFIKLEKKYNIKLLFVGSPEYAKSGDYALMELLVEKEK